MIKVFNIKEHESLLRQPSEEIDFNNPQIDLQQLSSDLFNILKEKNGLGLSAPQIGIHYRAFIMKGTEGYVVCFNPDIVDESVGVQDLGLEGCMSFPFLFIRINRPRLIKVRYTNLNGEVETKKLSNLDARIFCHEFDHLNGILMVDRASKLRLELAKRKRKILLRRKQRYDKKIMRGNRCLN